MGNEQSVNRFDSAVEKLSSQIGDCVEQEERLKLAIIESAKANGGSASAETKELAKKLVRVRATIKGLHSGVDKSRTELQEKERRLVSAIQEETRRGQPINDRLAEELVRARKNLQDFDSAFENLQRSLESRKQAQASRKQALESRTQPQEQPAQEFNPPLFLDSFRQGIEHDNKKQYEKALSFYLEGIRQANEALLNIQNDKQRELIIERLPAYTKRAQELQNYLQKSCETHKAGLR